MERWGADFIVDEYHVVALAGPGIGLVRRIEVVDVQNATEIVATALGLKDHMVLVASEVLNR